MPFHPKCHIRTCAHELAPVGTGTAQFLHIFYPIRRLDHCIVLSVLLLRMSIQEEYDSRTTQNDEKREQQNSKLQPPKKTATQSCQVELIASAVKVETSQKTKVFQPKYPSKNKCKSQTKQMFVNKDQFDGYKNEELKWVPRSTSSSHQTSGSTSTRKASNEESPLRQFPKQQQPNTSNAKSRRQKRKRSRRPKAKTNTSAFSLRFKQMWIPKDLLRAQGYYEGQTKIWVPRTHTPKPQQPQRASMEYRWIPKSTLKAQGYYEGQEYLWLPKGKPILRQAQRTQQKPISQLEIAVNKATTMSKQELVNQVWLPKGSTKESHVPTASCSSAN